MKSRLSHTATLTTDLDVRRVTWTTLAGRRFGEALIAIPRGHAAYDAAYLSPHGGSGVVIEDDRLGIWEGRSTRPTFTESGLTVTVRHIAAIAAIRLVPAAGTYEALTAGALVRLAATHAVAGLGDPAIRLGTFVEAAPVIESYSLTGQTLAEMLGDLQERTGQEATIEGGALSWVPPRANRYAQWLVTGSDLLGAVWEADADQRTAEVMATGSGRAGGFYRARDGKAQASGWPVQETLLSSGSALTLAQRAEAALSLKRRPRERVRARLAERHWSALREGDVVTVMDPSAGFGGRVSVGRIVSRTWEPGTLSVEIRIGEDATLADAADVSTPRVGSWDSLYRTLARVA